MADTNTIEQIATLIRRAENAAYERGKADAKRELLAFLGARVPDSVVAEQPEPSVHNDTRRTEGRQRAPKGIVPAFTRKALLKSSSRGLRPNEFHDYTETDDERMIKPASIRSELRIGREAGRYREENGRWFLVNGGEK